MLKKEETLKGAVVEIFQINLGGGGANGTSRATGLLRLVMTISSPRATAWRRAERDVFAS